MRPQHMPTRFVRSPVLNDSPDADFPEGGKVQSYGRIVGKGLKAYAPGPGMFCNGHNFPYPESFVEEVGHWKAGTPPVSGPTLDSPPAALPAGT